ncbi:MAG: hypothetical protein COV74_06590 [Candidatus Omnitrophica bacterium CG11_big_fil_rev_8_21_14_0_20_45_26]|uniref:Undecaprenyl-phosphate alpha-N-acetylglucosaminyl 1-phosphate transferase n=1 Tax=Candidatus Abzuiibacterium crystallinum TaxID=1974748 RepID=A0A2H0LR90_9BACT|nr:MAG: hypothetical protein COV74_06590 [Candidatus Omnitrophica bacterium CG11_big_fil_rev_8_21_14_0_20_45_26]PIW64742.1 MAG: hypothetical protein COW12_04985 [Candidatus Omnitrophica bacterium CG12_big_fil_rev_8_21_14_0_65_45_16]
MIPWDFFVVTALTSLVVSYGVSTLLVSQCRGRTSAKKRPTPPTTGGTVIFLSMAAVLLLLFVLYQRFFELNPKKLWGVAIAGAFIFLLGYIDDRKPLHYSQKLIGQILSACVLPLAGFKIDFITNIGGTALYLPDWMSGVFIVGWLVFMMNAVNLIDGLDGLAAGVIAMAAYTIFLLCWNVNAVISAGALALAFSLLGILPFNAYPARFYLGDAGSLLIGFLIGIFSLFFQVKTYAAVVIIIPLFILFIPVLNTAMVFVKRLKRGRNPLKGDIFHLHYRLLRQGLSHRNTVLFLWSVTASLCVLVVLRQYLPVRPRTILFLIGVLVLYTVLVQLFLGYLKEKRQEAVNRRK